MFQQMALFTDMPAKTYIRPHEKLYDWNTAHTWAYYGFKVAPDEIMRPVAYICQAGQPVAVYSFDQVDLIPKAETRLYNRRLQWIESYPV
jgi:hypothetical protein